jgi:hypothetical protein
LLPNLAAAGPPEELRGICGFRQDYGVFYKILIFRTPFACIASRHFAPCAETPPREFELKTGRHHRNVALTLVAAAWVGLFVCPAHTRHSDVYGGTVARLNHSSNLPTAPARSVSASHLGPLLQMHESKRELLESDGASKSFSSVPYAPIVRSIPCDQTISVPMPDHMIELPGTPPPALV